MIVRFKSQNGKRKNKYKPKEEKVSFWNLAHLQLEEFRPGINSKTEIGDEQKILNPNETYFIPSGELHGYAASLKKLYLIKVLF